MCHYACVWALSKLVSSPREMYKLRCIFKKCLFGKVFAPLLNVIQHTHWHIKYIKLQYMSSDNLRIISRSLIIMPIRHLNFGSDTKPLLFFDTVLIQQNKSVFYCMLCKCEIFKLISALIKQLKTCTNVQIINISDQSEQDYKSHQTFCTW